MEPVGARGIKPVAGYQAEGPQWRNIYLSAAKELREGVTPNPFTSASPDTILAMPVDILFDFAAIQIDGPAAANVDLRIDFVSADLDETWTAWIKRGVLNARKGASPNPQLTISGPKAALVGAILQPASAAKLGEAGQITLDGDASALDTYARLLHEFDPSFEIIAP